MIPNKIPVTLLTGFLGSGKTTVLNHLVQQPELSDALVIINEFGEIALDHLIVAHSTENLVMEMSNGCLCCTVRGDLIKTLRDITFRFSKTEQRPFSRVIIETTGLADPLPIVHTLITHPEIASVYRLDGISTTIDLATGDSTLTQHTEAIKQAAVADTLLLTKSDLATSNQRSVLLNRLDRINPAAQAWEVSNGVILPERILNLGLFSAKGKTPDVERWLREEAYAESLSCTHAHFHDKHDEDHEHNHQDVNRHDDHIRAFCFAVEDPIPDQTLTAWLEVLMSFVGNNILRVKGILNIDSSPTPLVLHGVKHIFHQPVTLPAWPSEDRRSRLVFITKDVDREVIEKTFHAFRRVLPQALDAL